MNNTNKKNKPSDQRKPFFARFLEKQALQDVVGGNEPPQTLKFPSDTDEVIASS